MCNFFFNLKGDKFFSFCLYTPPLPRRVSAACNSSLITIRFGTWQENWIFLSLSSLIFLSPAHFDSHQLFMIFVALCLSHPARDVSRECRDYQSQIRTKRGARKSPLARTPLVDDFFRVKYRFSLIGCGHISRECRDFSRLELILLAFNRRLSRSATANNVFGMARKTLEVRKQKNKRSALDLWKRSKFYGSSFHFLRDSEKGASTFRPRDKGFFECGVILLPRPQVFLDRLLLD